MNNLNSKKISLRQVVEFVRSRGKNGVTRHDVEKRFQVSMSVANTKLTSGFLEGFLNRTGETNRLQTYLYADDFDPESMTGRYHNVLLTGKRLASPKKLIAFCESRVEVTLKEIAEEFGVSVPTADRCVRDALKDKKLCRRQRNKGASAPYYYSVPGTFPESMVEKQEAQA